MSEFHGAYGNKQIKFERSDGQTLEILTGKGDERLSVSLDPEDKFHESDSHIIVISGQLCYQQEKNISAADFSTHLASESFSYQHLGGHFSLFVFEKTSAKLSLVSDKFTTHPWYYGAIDNQFYFSKRLKNLVSVLSEKPDINPQAIYNYVYFHCIPSPLTIYQGIEKIEPAQCVTFTGSIEKQAYYTPRFDDRAHHTDSLLSSLQGALDEGVQQSLTDQDPAATGAFLSGGLDSSGVVGSLAGNLSQPAKTFTIGFDAQGYDETPYAKLVADHFKTQHEVYYVTPQDVANTLPDLAAFYDEPFGNSSALPTYFCARFAKQKGVTTLLAGDGGDELFAGNARYAKQQQFEVYFLLPKFIRTWLVEKPVAGLNALLNIGLFRKAKSYIDQANVRLPDRLQTYNFLHQFSPDEVFEGHFLSGVSTDVPLQTQRNRYNEANKGDTLDQMLYLDWKFTLADNDLVKVNSMCEFAGVKVHYPMLNDALVDLSLKVPSATKLPGNKLRQFYKDAMKGFLPDETLNKSKHGFGLPFGEWMRNDKQLQDMAESALNHLYQLNIFKPAFLDKVMEVHKQGHAGYYGELVWILTMLSLWLQAQEQK